ncbi:MAG: C40 family peptidase [Desulfobacterales bacterium]
MPDRFFITRILIIIVMPQILFVICSCSVNRKESFTDYGILRGEAQCSLPFYDPVFYMKKNQEESRKDAENSFSRPDESYPPDSAPPHKPPPAKPHEAAEDAVCEAEAEKTELAGKKSVSLPDMDFCKEYSRKLGMELDGTENRKLIRAVAEWMGTPYLWGGCSQKGVDCSCLVKNIYEDVYGIELRRTSVEMCNADFMPVEKQRLREGDIICFGTKEDDISHVGLYLKNNKFVHASQSGGVRISSLERNYFKKRLIMAGRTIRPLQISLARLSISELVVVNP